MKKLAYLFLFLFVCAAFVPAAHASTTKTYTFISSSNGFLAGATSVNRTFIIAGSNELFEYQNGTFKEVYTPSGKIITDITTDGDSIYITEVELDTRDSGTTYNGNGDSGPGYDNGYDNDSGGSSTDNATVQSVPDPPRELQATVSSGAVVLGWYAPTNDGNSTITTYKIYRGTTHGEESYFASVSPTANGVYSYNDTDVLADHTYYYYVTAVNGIGESSASNEVFAHVPSDNGGGGTTVQAHTTTITSLNDGYNVTNYTVVKLSQNYTVLDSWTLQNTVLYASAQQLPHAAQLVVEQGQIYLLISGEDADNTLNYSTQLYKLTNGEYTMELSSSEYVTAVTADSSHIYMKIKDTKIEVYSLTDFSLTASGSDLSGARDVYNSIYANNNTLYLAGYTYDSSETMRAAYLVENSDLSSLSYYRDFNDTSQFAALAVYNNHTVFLSGDSKLFVFNNPNLIYAGRTDTTYVKNIDDGMYYDKSQNIFKAEYLHMFSDASATYHYAWGGYYMTWDSHMYMYVTLSDRPDDWTDFQAAGAWIFYQFAANDYWYWVVEIIAVIGVTVYVIERKHRRRRHR